MCSSVGLRHPPAERKVSRTHWHWREVTCPVAALPCAARIDRPPGCKRYVGPACTADFPRLRTPAQMTPIPARSDRMRCTGLVLIMSENAAPQKHGAGDDISSSSSADVRVQRDALLTEELAENCDMKMFMLHADGSHLSQVRSVAARPISEELFAAQAFVLAMDGIHARTCAVTACSFDFAISGQSFARCLRLSASPSSESTAASMRRPTGRTQRTRDRSAHTTEDAFSCRCAHRSQCSAGAIFAVFGASQRSLAF